jgi:hypothetical protein
MGDLRPGKLRRATFGQSIHRSATRGRQTVLVVRFLVRLNVTQTKTFRPWAQSRIRVAIIDSLPDQLKRLSLKCLLVHQDCVHLILTLQLEQVFLIADDGRNC